jgi:hypothetical protein
VNLVLDLWLVADRSGFLLQYRRARVQDLEFDGMSRVLPRSDSYNDNGSAFGRLP